MVVTANATPMQKLLDSKFAPYLGMFLAALIGILFAWAGLFTIFCGMGGGLLIGVLLYMLPKSMGAKWKEMAVFGVIFFVVCSAFAAFAVSKPLIENFESSSSHGDFENIVVTPFWSDASDTYTISMDYTGSEAGKPVTLELRKVTSVWTNVWTHESDVRASVTQTLVLGTNTFTVTLTGDDIYDYIFHIKESTAADAKTVVSSGYLIGPVLMDDVGMFCFQWNLYGIGLYVMLIFFMVLLLTTWMRKKLEDTRERLEKEGRLYPQGYGRCKDCGTIILPGEVTCRKCGAYIEVPTEMKVNKVEFFECSECGKEVPVNVDTCPNCGATFDGIEDEADVKTIDVPADVLDEKEIIENPVCSECGKPVDADAIRCPHCGERFDN